MLTGNFYLCDQVQHHESRVEAGIRFHPGHPIFTGHYPGQPIVPGACLLVLIREMLQLGLQQELQFMKADYLKLIHPVIPDEGKQFLLQINYTQVVEGFKVMATLQSEAVNFKFQGYYRHLV